MKPKILISKCLGFENCRYNGAIVQFDLLDKMKDQIKQQIQMERTKAFFDGIKAKHKVEVK